MAPLSSILAWKIPWTEEPGRLQSMGSPRVRHDWVTSLSLVHFHALEKEMATHSSVFAWRIPGTGEPGGLPSLGSHRVGHDWSDLAAAAAAGRECNFPDEPQSLANYSAVLGFSFNAWASLVAQKVKHPPVMWETMVQSLGWEDPLEIGMATHSSILAWRIPWTEESGGLHSMELQRAGHDSMTNSLLTLFIWKRGDPSSSQL